MQQFFSFLFNFLRLVIPGWPPPVVVLSGFFLMAFAQFGKGFAPRVQRPAAEAPTARSGATRLFISALLRALAQKWSGHRSPGSEPENDKCAQRTRFPGPCRGYVPPATPGVPWLSGRGAAK